MPLAVVFGCFCITLIQIWRHLAISIKSVTPRSNELNDHLALYPDVICVMVPCCDCDIYCKDEHHGFKIGSSRRTIFKYENFSCSWWGGILLSPPGKMIMFSPKVSDFWAENTFFLILLSRRDWVGNQNQSIFPVPVVQLSPNFLHMVLISPPRYHAKNFLIVSPFVYFLVYALIKIPSLAEIPS